MESGGLISELDKLEIVYQEGAQPLADYEQEELRIGLAEAISVKLRLDELSHLERAAKDAIAPLVRERIKSAKSSDGWVLRWIAPSTSREVSAELLASASILM